MNWSSSAFVIEAASLPGDVVRIFVPKSSLEKATELVGNITENNA
jgi:hypothetical protein